VPQSLRTSGLELCQSALLDSVSGREAFNCLLTPTRVDDFTLSVPYNDDLHPEDWTMDDPDIEPPRCCLRQREGVRHGIVQEIVPSDDGTCQVTAPEYKEIFYAYDDATYPGDVA
jgi:hypothetical protein